MTNSDIQADVTARILEALESNLLPWRRGWKCSPNAGLCTSLSTGNEYAGVNQILLQLASWKSGFESKWWGTYRQIQKAGSNVKRGERGTRIVLYKAVERRCVDGDVEERADNFLIMKSFVVFNAEQSRDLDRFHVTDVPDSTSTFERHEQAEELIRASSCTFNFNGSKAFYCPESDEITMPRRETFESAETFLKTALHELCHHAESRTGFDRSKAENSYSFGELAAEMGSCFLMARLQLETRSSIENSAAYLQHWLRAIRQDNRFIFRAASQAQKAADFIWSRAVCPIEVPDVMSVMTPA